MGQNQSNLNSARPQTQGTISIPPINQMKQSASGNDIRYGDIRIMQTETGQLLVVKDNVFQDQESWKQFKSKCEQQINHESDAFLIRLLSLQYNTESELCSTFTKATCVYEYYPHDLRKDIDDLREQGQMYQEIEIVAMLKCMVDALVALNFIRESHGDLRASTILMTAPSVHNEFKQSTSVPSPVYKVTNIQELTKQNAYKRVLTKTNDENTLLLSPEQLNDLRFENIKPSYDPYKSDLFSLGLVAIEMATLQDLAPIYDMEQKIMRINVLEQFIEMVSQKYSERLIKILEHLINFSPDKRPDLMMASALFAPYQFQLEDYFNASSLKFTTLNFSRDLGTIGSGNNTNQFLPMPMPQSQQQPLQNVTNRNPTQLHNQINELDSKVKNVLKRSMEAQQKYLQSPSGRRYEQQNSDSRMSQFEQYQQLPPITLADLVAFSPQRNEDDPDFSQRESFPYQQHLTPFSNSVQAVQSYNLSVPRNEERGSNPNRNSEVLKQSLSLKHQQPTISINAQTHSSDLLQTHAQVTQQTHYGQLTNEQAVNAQTSHFQGANFQDQKHQINPNKQSHGPNTRASGFQPQNFSQAAQLHEFHQSGNQLQGQPTQKVLSQLQNQDSHTQLQLQTYNSGAIKSDLSHDRHDSPPQNQSSPQGTYAYKQKQYHNPFLLRSLKDSKDSQNFAQITLGRQDLQAVHSLTKDPKLSQTSNPIISNLIKDTRNSQTSQIKLSQTNNEAEVLRQLTGSFNKEGQFNSSAQAQLLATPQQQNQPAQSVKSVAKSGSKLGVNKSTTGKPGMQGSSAKKTTVQRTTTTTTATNKLKSQFKK